MYRHYTLISSKLLLVVVAVMIAIPCSAMRQYSLEEILKNLESASTLTRRVAQTNLIDYLQYADSQERPARIQELIELLPAGTDFLKLGIAEALGGVNFFWETDNHEETTQFLYTLYLNEKNSRLKKALDSALMRARGLYRDAMNSYNTDQVGPAVEEKFRRTFETFTKSSYAPMAHFYLGRYFTRAYFILQQRGENPTLEYIHRSNEVFQEFLDRMADGTYQPRDEQHAFMLDAQYFRALNFVLLDQVDRAIAELKALETVARSADTSIYIYQFYPSPRTTDVIDEYLPAVSLARYTRNYLENEGRLNSDNMEKFIRGLVYSVPLRKQE